MQTPVYDYVSAYQHQDPVRFHMPGHKGVDFLGCEGRDITEIEGADDLYHADGILLESEQNATAHFQSQHTFYSTGGSSQSIRAMLHLALQADHGNTRPHVLAGRNAHKALLYSAALLDFDITWLCPRGQTLCACPLTATELAHALQTAPTKPFAVYVTSPDYVGQVLDIAQLAAVCRAQDVPLLVDNAHGAYLHFLPVPQHPLDAGATMCCDSAHKTLPVLTGGGYLHISQQAPRAYVEFARASLALFGSTSPSYLVLQSLDLCNAYLATYPARLAVCVAAVQACKCALSADGWEICPSEWLKITIDPRPHGQTGQAIATHLAEQGIHVEYADPDFVVLMCTPENTPRDYTRLRTALQRVPAQARLAVRTVVAPAPLETVCSIRTALLGRQEKIDTRTAVGRVCAAPVVSCPPAIPLAVSGERITAETVQLLLQYDMQQVMVMPNQP